MIHEELCENLTIYRKPRGKNFLQKVYFMHAVYVGIIGDKVESEKKSNFRSVADCEENSRSATAYHISLAHKTGHKFKNKFITFP